MAWLDFIKQIRADEEEELKRQKEGGIKNRVFGFLDDALDVGGRGVNSASDFVRRSFEETEQGQQAMRVANDTLEMGKDVVGGVAGWGRETLITPFVRYQQAAEEGAVDDRVQKIDSILGYSEEERNKIAEDSDHKYNPLFRLEKEKYGDLSDKTLGKVRNDLLKEQEEVAKPYTPDSRLERMIFGNEDIHSTTDEKRVGTEWAEERGFGDLSPAIGTAYGIGMGALNLPVVSGITAGAKAGVKGLVNVSDDVIESLAKNVDVKDISNTLQNTTKMVKEEADKLADMISGTDNTAQIKEIVNGKVQALREGASAGMPVGETNEQLTVYRGGDPEERVNYVTENRDFAQKFADDMSEDVAATGRRSEVREYNINRSDMFDPRIPEHRQQMVDAVGEDRTNALLSRTPSGTFLSDNESVAKDIAGRLGYKGVAIDELDNTPLPANAMAPIQNGSVGYTIIDDAAVRPAQAAVEATPTETVMNAVKTVEPPQAPPQVDEALPQREIDEMVESAAQEYRDTDEIVDELTDLWFNEEKGRMGGQLIDTTGYREAYGEGRKRITEHGQFYRNHYAENGRAPTKADFRQEIIRQLENGGGNMVAKEESDIYGLVRNRVEENNALMQASPTDDFMQAIQPPRSTPPTTPRDLTPGPGRTRLRGFLNSSRNPEGPMNEPLRQQAEQVTPQRYTQQAQAPVIEAAKRRVDENIFEAEKFARDESIAWSDEKAAVLEQLILKHQSEGRIDEALDLLDQVDKQAREAGRGNAMLAAWSKLSPQGVLRFAKREVEKATENAKKGVLNKITGTKQDPQNVAKDIQEEITEAVTLDTKQANKAVDQAIKDIENPKSTAGAGGSKTSTTRTVKEGDPEEPATVGEKVAKNIGSYMSPSKKKKVDTLVTELTKKIKQELIAPKPKAEQRSALNVLQEVFARRGEADEAWPEAKELLKEQFKDKPEILSQLDEFFEANLLSPAASKTLDRAIMDTMKANKIKIAESIKKSWDGQIVDITKVADDLTKSGFSADDARVIAEEVGSRVKTQMDEAKRKTLERMMKDAPERVRSVFEDKIAKLSNIGALDDADYLELAQTRLGLPTLDQGTAERISGLAQKMQAMPDGVEKNEVIAQIMDEIAATMPPTAAEKFNAFRYQNLLSSPRTQLRNIAANTFNALITRPATLFTGAAGDTVSTMMSGKPRERFFSELPEYYKGLMKGYFDSQEAMKAAWEGRTNTTNLDLIDQFGESGIEQARMRNLPKKWTVVSRLMEAQDKLISGMIAGGEYSAQIKRGVDPETAKAAAQAMGEYSLLRQALDPTNKNGQGAMLSAIDKVSQQFLDMVNYIPGGRWVVPFVRTPLNFAKQWIEFSPAGLANAVVGGKSMSPERRLESLNKGLLGTGVMGMGAVLAADDRLTWSVPNNQTDRDLFYAEGKKPYSVKIGENWYPLINFGPFGLAMGMAAGAKHNFSESANSVNDSLPEKLLSTAMDLGEMLSQQTFLTGVQDFYEAVNGDNPDRVQKVMASLTSQAIPLSGLVRYVSTVVDPTYREAEGFVQTLQKDIPFLSYGLEEQKNSATGEPTVRNVSDYLAPYSIGMPDKDPEKQANTEMYASFYRSIRKGSDNRTKTSQEITKALVDGDRAKAMELADKHNRQVAAQVQAFLEKHRERLASNPQFREEFAQQIRSAMIPLNNRSIRDRLEGDASKQQLSQWLSQ